MSEVEQAAESVTDQTLVPTEADLTDGGAPIELPSQVAAIRPDFLPEACWDELTGSLRPEALLDAYRALVDEQSRKLAIPTGPDDQAAIDRLQSVLGRPASAAGYQVSTSHPLLERDDTVNERLHAAGFTQHQAQLVYDLAGEVMVPVVEDLLGRLQAEQELQHLTGEFGGPEGWAEVARELRMWGRANLDPPTYEALATTAHGVRAMVQLMRSREPTLVGQSEADPAPLDEGLLHEMVRDPRYWRDRDPTFVARVTQGFERLYGR